MAPVGTTETLIAIPIVTVQTATVVTPMMIGVGTIVEEAVGAMNATTAMMTIMTAITMNVIVATSTIQTTIMTIVIGIGGTIISMRSIGVEGWMAEVVVGAQDVTTIA